MIIVDILCKRIFFFGENILQVFAKTVMMTIVPKHQTSIINAPYTIESNVVQ